MHTEDAHTVCSNSYTLSLFMRGVPTALIGCKSLQLEIYNLCPLSLSVTTREKLEQSKKYIIDFSSHLSMIESQH